VVLKVVNQPYNAKVFEEDVIRGNAAIFKCTTPTYVNDFLMIDSWTVNGMRVLGNDNYGMHYAYRIGMAFVILVKIQSDWKGLHLSNKRHHYLIKS